MFPKKGNLFPGGNDRENGSGKYASIIATALQKELGNSHRATKTVMRWTGASERTVKHWLAGHNGPGGAYLIVLMRESETVYEAVLAAAGRRDAIVAARVLAAHRTIAEVMALIDREKGGPPGTRPMEAARENGPAEKGLDDRKNDRTNDPINDRNRGSSEPPPGDGLNPRQRWYLEALAAGKEVRADDLRHRWSVSEKTARRDVAALKERGMIEFVGPLRTGRYRLRC
jgi:hypothetical protein